MMVDENNNSVDSTDDEILLFEDDETEMTNQASETVDCWKMIIVDDEPAVHQATKLALKNFTFEGKPLTFLSAYSSGEAMELIAANPDAAFILLDVVMETQDAGLRVVRYVREVLGNKRSQIILRTGQPGEAPEESIINNYDINDYKLKVELTRQKLVTTAIAALRSHRNVVAVEEQTVQLAQALESLQETQLQLVQSEKMSALGNLVAGVGHEINNPLTFIAVSISTLNEGIQDLLQLIDLYQEKYPSSGSEISEKIDAIELEYLREDLPKILNQMNDATKRMYNISNGLRNFSRSDNTSKIPFNIHEGIDSTLLILKHRLAATETRPAIEIIRNYIELPVVECSPGQLNQVFMNLLSNAIDSLESSNKGRSFKEIHDRPNQITISTQLTDQQDCIAIKIKDNGVGMSSEVKQKIFNHLFTTKPVGKGTGLGLSIARQIIVEKHGGRLEVDSALGQGAEFTIVIPIQQSENKIHKNQNLSTFGDRHQIPTCGR